MDNFGYKVNDLVTSKKDHYHKKYGKDFSKNDIFIVTGFDEKNRIWLYKDTETGHMGFYIKEFEEYFLTLGEFRDKRINDILNDE